MEVSKAVVGSVGVRVFTLPVSVVCSFFSTSLIIRDQGAQTYAIISVIMGLALLFPFLDLGTGAAVLTGAARYTRSNDIRQLAEPLRRGLIVTILSSAAACIAAMVVLVFDQWGNALGFSGNAGVGPAVVVLFALNISARPLLLLTTALTGIGAGVAATTVQIVVPIVSVLVIVSAIFLDAPLALFTAATIIGQIVCGAGVAALLVRRCPGLGARILSGTAFKDQVPASVRATAAPMLAITVLASFSINADRLLLSHLSSTDQLAAFAICAQIYQPLMSLIATAQQPLWADFTARRHSNDCKLRTMFATATVVSGIAALVVTVVLTPAVPLLASFVSHGQVTVAILLSLMFGMSLCCSALQMPAGAILTTEAGLRFQAGAIAVGLLVNMVVTVQLIPNLGAAGAVIGTVVGNASVLLLTTWRVRREFQLYFLSRKEEINGS